MKQEINMYLHLHITVFNQFKSNTNNVTITTKSFVHFVLAFLEAVHNHTKTDSLRDPELTLDIFRRQLKTYFFTLY